MREQSADLDILGRSGRQAPHQSQARQQRGLGVGHHPEPVKVWEAAVRVLALAQTPARILRRIRLTLHSGEAGLVP